MKSVYFIFYHVIVDGVDVREQDGVLFIDDYKLLKTDNSNVQKSIGELILKQLISPYVVTFASISN